MFVSLFKMRMPCCHRHGGYTFAENPTQPAGAALTVWRADFDASVLPVIAEHARAPHPDDFDLRTLPCPVLVFRGLDGIERILLDDGPYRLRLDIIAGSVLDGPCRFRYDLAGCEAVPENLKTLQKLLALKRLGRFPRMLFPPDPRAGRWRQVLRAFDARADGATQREIAIALYGADIVGADWRGHSDYLRSRVQRALRLGHELVQGGYRRFLQ